NPARLSTDALVVPVHDDDGTAALMPNPLLDQKVREELSATIDVLDISGAAEKITRVPAPPGVAASTVVFAGVGQISGGPDLEQLRRAAGAALGELDKVATVALLFGTDEPESLGAVAEGALLGAYRFGRYRKDVSTVTQILVLSGAAKDKEAKAAVERARVVAAHVNATRDLVNTSPRDLYPESFADTARTLVKGTKVNIEILDEAALRSGGYGGLVGVGQGSSRGPRLVT